MYDLTDVTFTIPLRIDSKERLENIHFVIEFLRRNFKTNIMVLEDGPEKKTKLDCDYVFCENQDKTFHRTRILNEMCRNADTPIIANYDCDVLFPIQQLTQAVESIRNNTLDGVLPYGGLFGDVDRKWMPVIRETNTLAKIPFTQILNQNSGGGCIFWDKEKFIQGGMENEHFRSWGYEDNERLYRFQTLGYRIGRIPGNLYHLTHPRGKNSSGENPHLAQNKAELDKVRGMDRLELWDYLQNWTWLC
jgi:hypothetical protein